MRPALVTSRTPPVRPSGAGRRPSNDRSALDHDLLLGAIACRLSACVDTLPAVPAPARDMLHECVRALEQMRPGLAQERGYAERVERELQDVRSALAAARLDLAGTRDGERRALHLADHDGLTALPNRNCFQARLDEALARRAAASEADGPASTLAVLFLDLDDFKPINDRHGHQTGDELLRIVAQRLSRAVRGGDMVCRFGGDEFACLLSAPMGRQQLSHVASKLFDAISAPLRLGPLELTVRPSIGIAMCPGDGHTAASLLQHADRAMYRAKRRQLGYTFFDGHVDT